MQVLFVHGMGRSPLSGWPMLRELRRRGCTPATFGYMVALESFDAITRRLADRLSKLASQGEYVVVGHSLGGVLLRAALGDLPPSMRQPTHVFLLGSPLRPSSLARRLAVNPVFRALTQDCGALLRSDERMATIRPLVAPATGIAGIRSIRLTDGYFAGESNDGVVSVPEVSAPWLTDQVLVPIVHALLPSSRQVAGIVLARLGQCGESAPGDP